MGDTFVDALRGVDLSIARGEFVALVGPSGSGKSTVLNLIGGLDRPTSGDVWINGTELGNSDERTLTRHRRSSVGFVFQSFNLLPRLTAEENVALPLMFSGVPEKERLTRARALLERVGLGPRLAHRPTQLSGGEQQRVAIARALVARPAILLADEPTGNLDTVTGADIMGLLQELNQERTLTLLTVTHDPEVAAFADRVVRLRDGRVIS
jgi:putative ABC transport system ATP-binding protein